MSARPRTTSFADAKGNNPAFGGFKISRKYGRRGRICSFDYCKIMNLSIAYDDYTIQLASAIFDGGLLSVEIVF